MKIYVDGYCLSSNPSDIGGGYTIFNENNNILHHERIKKKGLTNNEAELLGCVHALMLAKDGDIIITDSMNNVRWIKNISKHLNKINSKKKRGREDLDYIKLIGNKLLASKKIQLIWEPRDKNLAGIYNESMGFDVRMNLPDSNTK